MKLRLIVRQPGASITSQFPDYVVFICWLYGHFKTVPAYLPFGSANLAFRSPNSFSRRMDGWRSVMASIQQVLGS